MTYRRDFLNDDDGDYIRPHVQAMIAYMALVWVLEACEEETLWPTKSPL